MRHLSHLDNLPLSLTFLSAEIDAESSHVGLCLCECGNVCVSPCLQEQNNRQGRKAVRQLFCHAQINTADPSPLLLWWQTFCAISVKDVRIWKLYQKPVTRFITQTLIINSKMNDGRK